MTIKPKQRCYADRSKVFDWLTANRKDFAGLNNYALQERATKALGKQVRALDIRLWSNEHEWGAIKSFPTR